MAKLVPVDGDPFKAAASSGLQLVPVQGDPFAVKPAQAKQAPQKEVGSLDRARAAAAGVNRGFYADLLGMPVDAAANVLDLSKAAAGYLYSKGRGSITGKQEVPPAWTEPFDRSGIVGSADWIAGRINNAADTLGVASPINNPNPQDPASRVLNMGGRFVGASVVPNPRAPIGASQQAINAVKAGVGGLSAGMVGEVAPEYAGLAGMAPQIVGAVTAAGTKMAIRGGESGRREMAQRLQDFKNAGVENPSVGLASGNSGVMGVENLLANTPGSVGLYEKNKLAMLSGLQERANQIRNSLSPVYGAQEAGAAIQSDLKGAFKDRIGNTYSRLNDRVEQAVGPDTLVPVNESLLKSKQLTTPISGAETTSSLLIQPRIKNIQDALQADAGGKPAQTVYVGGQAVQVPAGHHGSKTIQQPGLLDAGGNALTRTIPATPPKGLPFSALKELRTKIGKEAQSNAIMGTPEQADFKQLYGAMSQDMKNAVTLADMQNSAGKNKLMFPATEALGRANTYYSNAMDRADKLNALANNNTPEGAFNSVANSLTSGPTTYARVRNAVTPETRGKIAATVVDEMGMATPGNQGAKGDTWSPKTFLTNYNKIEPQARQELFKRLPGGEQQAQNLAEIAKATDMIAQGSKIWANPSGTAAAMASRGAIGTLTVGAFFDPILAGSVAGTLVLGNQASKRLLLNPKFTEWLAKAPEVKPQEAQNYALRLIEAAKATNDKQFQQDVAAYIRSVEQSKQKDSDANNR